MNTANHKPLWPFVLSIAGSALMLLTVFLPYASAAEDTIFRRSPDVVSDGVRAGDLADVSMFDFARLYRQMASSSGQRAQATVTTVLVAAIVCTAVLALVFALLRKGVPTIVFTVVSFAAFLAFHWDCSDRGVVGNDTYGLGFGYYLFFVAAAIALAGGIWTVVAKRRAR